MTIPAATYALIFGIPAFAAVFSVILWFVGGRIFDSKEKEGENR